MEKQPSKSTFNRHVLEVMNSPEEGWFSTIRKKYGRNYLERVYRKAAKCEEVHLHDCPEYGS